MKLSEITNKEHFKNMLKDPELEKVRQGLEELSKTFIAYNWEFETKLDSKGKIYWIYVIQYPLSDERVKNNMTPLNHMETIRKMFPDKDIRRGIKKENNNTFVYSVNIYKELVHKGLI